MPETPAPEGLRAQIIDALVADAFRRADVKPTAFSKTVARANAEMRADAVLPVVQAALSAARSAATGSNWQERAEQAEAAVRQVRDVVAWLRSAEDEMSAIADRIDAALGQPDDALPKPCPLGLRLHTPHTWTDGGPIRDCPGITDQPEASSDG
jgi:hypothetical protein